MKIRNEYKKNKARLNAITMQTMLIVLQIWLIIFYDITSHFILS